jgi:hypothetical protein
LRLELVIELLGFFNLILGRCAALAPGGLIDAERYAASPSATVAGEKCELFFRGQWTSPASRTRRAVHAAVFGMDLLDLLDQPRVLKRAIGRRPRRR